MSLIFPPVFAENKRHPGRSVMNGAVLSAALRAFPLRGDFPIGLMLSSFVTEVNIWLL